MRQVLPPPFLPNRKGIAPTSVRLPAELKDRLDEIAKHHHTTFADVAERFLYWALMAWEQEQKRKQSP